jgi:hypothetical protein
MPAMLSPAGSVISLLETMRIGAPAIAETRKALDRAGHSGLNS